MKQNEEAHWRAVRRAGVKLGFLIHLAAYLSVNSLLVFINFSTSPQYLWFKWPLLGWGIGLFFHWLVVIAGPKLMRQFIARELDKDRFDG